MRRRFETRSLFARAAATLLPISIALLLSSVFVSGMVGEACASDALLDAAKRGDAGAVGRLLSGGAPPDYADDHGTTALHRAAKAGHADVVRALLVAGAFVDQTEYDGDTALVFAAKAGHADVVRILLEAGADDSIEGARGFTPIQLARRGKHKPIVALIRDAKRLRRQALARAPAPSGPTGGESRPPDASPRANGPTRARVQKTYRAGYERRIAAVIGVNAYTNWPPLAGARPDAERVARRLKELGFDEVLELYDAGATRRGILDLIGRQLSERVRENDLVMIFFAGHGQTETIEGGLKRGYIIPVDASLEDTFSTAIPMQTLREVTNRIPAKHVYYAMDSCYSGLGFTRGLSIAKPSEPDYISKVTSLRAVQMVTAGGEGEEAIERNGQGVFTTSLLEALEGRADANGDGFVTATEIGVYVAPRVTNQTGARQSPQAGRLEGEGEIAFEVRRR